LAEYFPCVSETYQADVVQKSLAAGVDVEGLQALGKRWKLFASGWREGWPLVAADVAAGLVAGRSGLSEPEVAAGPHAGDRRSEQGSAASRPGGSAPGLRSLGHHRSRKSSEPWRRLIRFSPPRSRPTAAATQGTRGHLQARQRRRAVAVRRWRATPPRPGLGESVAIPGERHWPDRQPSSGAGW